MELEPELEWWRLIDTDELEELCDSLCTFFLFLALAWNDLLVDDSECADLDDEWWRCLRTRIFRCLSFNLRSKSDEAEEDSDLAE